MLGWALGSSAAFADDFALKLEPGVALPLTAPQSTVYGVGVGQSVKAFYGVAPFLDVGPSAQFMYLSPAATGKESGTVWGLGGGLRLKLPHDSDLLFGASPWFDADALYIRTGPLDRPGFDAAVGFSIPIGESRNFWIGPFARYLHVVQIDRAGFDNHDAKLLTLGVSMEFGTGIARKDVFEPEPSVVIKEVVKEVVKEVAVCADKDLDGVPDSVDRCPDVVGTLENYGCRNYDKIVVKPDKLELKEKLYFAWDQATIEEASYPVLDEVAQALKDNRAFQVQVEGHTDSTGGDDHNQTLSEKRATAVLDYLVAHGIAKDRLISKGFSSSVPIDTNATAAGRENNRRVEFVVSFILVPGSAQ
jgi:outer membrane protein OmpA-like peptidoglycan-associated protein